MSAALVFYNMYTTIGEEGPAWTVVLREGENSFFLPNSVNNLSHNAKIVADVNV